jgi:hypothetical protein
MRCSHLNVAAGVLHCDLARVNNGNSFYSIQMRALICSDCGHIELYCESPAAACLWLTQANGQTSRAVLEADKSAY